MLYWLVSTRAAANQRLPQHQAHGGCACAGGLEPRPCVEPHFLTVSLAYAALKVGEVDVGRDRTGKCYGFSSFFFDSGPSPENARARVGVSLRDIVEDQSGFRS